jgi:membrane fusion protein (multidrug efflux system)
MSTSIDRQTLGPERALQNLRDIPVTPPAHPDIDHGATPPAPTALRSPLRSGIAVLAAAIGLLGFGLYLYAPGLYEVSTDDAFVDAHVIPIVPKLAAYVSHLHVDDNTRFAPGDLLVELDPRDFQVAVDSAVADLASARANAANIAAQLQEQQSVIDQSEATVAGDRATQSFAQQQLQRYGALAQTGFGTAERFQQAQSDNGQRQATLARDHAALQTARAHLAVLGTQAVQAQAAIDRQIAALAQARLNLSYTRIYAIEAGSVANKSVEVGSFVQPGQVLLSAVPDAVFITANFKETQLAHVRPGQPVRVRIDELPDEVLQGHVDSIQRGTGSQFALLPPENATGNFVKIVQRVPVKVMLDTQGGAVGRIAPGMSVEATIIFAQRPWWLHLLDLAGSEATR